METAQRQTVKKILETIDTSKMVTKNVCFYEMNETEFEIYEWTSQPENNERLTYCYYHSWICTDTEVGVRVWYLDNKPVCISWKPYRKSKEIFGWISEKDFVDVRKYIILLIDEEEFDKFIITDETINDTIKLFNSIDYKKFEKRNTK